MYGHPICRMLLVTVLPLLLVDCATVKTELEAIAPNKQNRAVLQVRDAVLGGIGGSLEINGRQGWSTAPLYVDDSGTSIEFAHVIWTDDSRTAIGIIHGHGVPLRKFAFSEGGALIPMNPQFESLLRASIASTYALPPGQPDPLIWVTTPEAAKRYASRHGR